MSKQNHVQTPDKQLAIERIVKPITHVVPQNTQKIVQKIPIFIKKNNKITLIEGQNANKLFLKHLQPTRNIQKVQFREDIIYQSKDGDFLRGDPQVNVVVLNRLDLLNNSCKTIARYRSQSDNSILYERTSDTITKIIGQENYDTVFSALCSVINQELKVKGIMGLLVVENTETVQKAKEKAYTEKCTQTDINCIEWIYKSKQKKRIKRSQLIPYVVKDNPTEKKRVVVHPENAKITNETEEGSQMKNSSELPEIHLINEDSNASVSSIGNMSMLSGFSMTGLLENPTEILKNIDRCTAMGNNKLEQNHSQQLPPSNLDSAKMQETKSTSANYSTKLQDTEQNSSSDLKMLQPSNMSPTDQKSVQQKFYPAYITTLDGTQIMVSVKPEDQFHIATPEILKSVTLHERKKLLLHQAYIDWKLCLQRDEDDNLPIHQAVMNNDTDVLRRQCLVLKNRNESVDITAGNLTALQMSIRQDTPECTSILLQHGADPLFVDEEHRTALHLAAEGAAAHLRALLSYAANEARQILQDHEDLWRPEMENKTDDQLAAYLLNYMCKMADNQGYTPLMLASKMGNYANAKMLAEASPHSVDAQMPNSGNTALYLAIGAACLDAADRGNKSKVPEHFYRTISILVEHGADPNIKNYSNSDVTDLLTEFNIAELSMLVANKMHRNKFGEMPNAFDSYMIFKDKDGRKNIMDIKSKVIPSKIPQTNSGNPRVQTDNVSDKTVISSDQSVDNPAYQSGAPQKVVCQVSTVSKNLPEQNISAKKQIAKRNSPLILKKTGDSVTRNEEIDNNDKSIEKQSLVKIAIAVPVKKIGKLKKHTIHGKKSPEDEGRTSITLTKTDSTVKSSNIKLQDNKSDVSQEEQLSDISETKTKSSEKMETDTSLKSRKRKGTSVKPGPSGKKREHVLSTGK